MHLAIISHHKTGSSYSGKVVKEFLQTDQQTFKHFHAFLGWKHRETGEQLSQFKHPSEPTIYHIANVASSVADLLPENTRILHFLRDPRGIILSAIAYHKRGSEDWTREPWEKLGGKTYQEHILSLGSQDKEVAFEIAESSGRQIGSIRSWVDKPGVEQFKLEDISHDATCKTQFRLAQATGLIGPELLSFFNIACSHALWNQTKRLKHTTTGVATDYGSRYDAAARKVYEQELGDLHEQWGYPGWN